MRSLVPPSGAGYGAFSFTFAASAFLKESRGPTGSRCAFDAPFASAGLAGGEGGGEMAGGGPAGGTAGAGAGVGTSGVGGVEAGSLIGVGVGAAAGSAGGGEELSELMAFDARKERVPYNAANVSTTATSATEPITSALLCRGREPIFRLLNGWIAAGRCG